jgi:PKHD-type hydroxylase
METATMMVAIPDVLTATEARRCRRMLEKANWGEGRRTAGALAARVKQNEQLADGDPLVAELGSFLLERLAVAGRFVAAALPAKVVPPRFNRYADDGFYGDHVDGAVFVVPDTSVRIRGDLSATLFLSDPGDYDGGELTVQGEFAPHRVKLPAGHMILYSSGAVHHVAPVTRGARYAAFFWMQSLVREDHRRRMLLELDDTIQALAAQEPEASAVTRLTALYHNLLRDWADT